MNRLMILIRKELQQHRGMFIILPLALTAIMAVVILGGVTTTIVSDGHSYNISADRSDAMPDQEQGGIRSFYGTAIQKLAAMDPVRREHVLEQTLNGLAAPLLISLALVVFVYLVMTLHDERKDRSILFWKSMPVSDAMTVIARLVSITLVVPAIYLGCIMLVHLVALVVASFNAMHQSVPVWQTVWEPAHVLVRWFNYAGYLVLNSIWSLPWYAWLLLVSAWARSVPVAWAILVPFFLSVLEKVFTPSHWLSHWMWVSSLPLGLGQGVTLNAGGAMQLLMTPVTVFGLVAAAAMLYGAIRIRGRTDEI